MSEGVGALPARLRGQALYHMSKYQAFDEDSDHSEGLFIHAGIVFAWRIGEFAGHLSVTLGLGDEMLL